MAEGRDAHVQIGNDGPQARVENASLRMRRCKITVVSRDFFSPQVFPPYYSSTRTRRDDAPSSKCQDTDSNSRTHQHLTAKSQLPHAKAFVESLSQNLIGI
jgi:hypothetical protein